MARLRATLSVLLLTTIAACDGLGTSRNGDVYPLDAVQVRGAERVADGGVTFDFRARTESGHYSPGANVHRLGDKALVQIVRLACDQEARADVAPTHTDGNGWATLAIPGVGDRALLLDDGIRTRELLPMLGGPR